MSGTTALVLLSTMVQCMAAASMVPSWNLLSSMVRSWTGLFVAPMALLTAMSAIFFMRSSVTIFMYFWMFFFRETAPSNIMESGSLLASASHLATCSLKRAIIAGYRSLRTPERAFDLSSTL